LVEGGDFDFWDLGEGLLVLVEELLLEGEHVGEEVALPGALVLESLAGELAGLLADALVVLLDLAFDFVACLEGFAFGGPSLGMIGKLHH
jgi:hypothetical protein